MNKKNCFCKTKMYRVEHSHWNQLPNHKRTPSINYTIFDDRKNRFEKRIDDAIYEKYIFGFLYSSIAV